MRLGLILGMNYQVNFWDKLNFGEKLNFGKYFSKLNLIFKRAQIFGLYCLNFFIDSSKIGSSQKSGVWLEFFFLKYIILEWKIKVI